MREGTIKEFVCSQLQKTALSKNQLAERIVKKWPYKKPEAMVRYMNVVFASLKDDGYDVRVDGQGRDGLNKYAVSVKSRGRRTK